MTDPPMSLAAFVGRAIRTMRAYRGMTQKELAARSGLDPSAISLIEAGKRAFSAESLERIVEALDSRLLFSIAPKENSDD